MANAFRHASRAIVRLLRHILHATQLDRVLCRILGIDDRQAALEAQISDLWNAVQGLDLARVIPLSQASPPQGATSSPPPPLGSMVCRADFWDRPYFEQWCSRMKEAPLYHRKVWEWVFIAQSLAERGLLRDGSRALGFAVGREPLPSLFASFGVSVLATDAPVDLDTTKLWERDGMYAADARVLNERSICTKAQELRLLRFERVDMRSIPEALRDFDFCWSSCALEHLGTLEAGLTFLRRSLDTLKPGGYAIHTTELNVFSDEDTVKESLFTVIYRERDLRQLMASLESEGHECSPIDFRYGDSEKDRFIDAAPFYTRQGPYFGRTHLKLLLEGFVSTSVALIVRKGQQAST